MIEDPCGKLQGIFDRREAYYFQIRSLTPQQSAGLALAFAVQAQHPKLPTTPTPERHNQHSPVHFRIP
jgi:hypothetical protein